MTALAQGWARPPGAHCWHFFIGPDSVCRGWIYPGADPAVAPPAGGRVCRRCGRYLRAPRPRGRR